MVAGTAAPYLLALRLDGRRVMVAGGGAVATRRVPGLLDAGADVLVVSPRDQRLAARPRGRRAGSGGSPREYAPGDCVPARGWSARAPTTPP